MSAAVHAHFFYLHFALHFCPHVFRRFHAQVFLLLNVVLTRAWLEEDGGWQTP